MNKNILIAIAIIIASFIIGIYIYPSMPDEMPSHWNSAGDVDDYMPKFWGLFLMPIVTLGILLLLVFLPRIDPSRMNVDKFRKYFEGFILVLVIFLFYMYILTLLYSLDYSFNMGQLMVPGLVLLFYYAGILIEHSKKNWFIGIRTPRTLSSDKVWDETHRLGGKLFKGAAIISLMGLLLPRYAILIVIIPIVFAAVYSVIYSYIVFKREKKK